MPKIMIRVLQHRKTGLIMAISDDVPGFVVHAHDEEEIARKLVPAYKAYMAALGEPDEAEFELVNNSTPGYWPPAFVLQAANKAAA